MNKSVSDIVTDYHEQVLRQQQRFERACQQNAKLQHVREQIREAGAEKLKAMVEGDGEPDANMEQLEAEADRLIAEEIGIPRYLCADCEDTGRIGESDCNCLLRQIYRDCYGAEDVQSLPASWADFNLQVFDNEYALPDGRTQRQQMKLFATRAKEYLDEFPNNRRPNLLFMGKAGLGKTFLMQCMANDAYSRGMDVMFIRSSALFHTFLQHRLGAAVNLSYMHQTDLLMIDDLGTEPMTQNVTKEYLYNLVDSRIQKKLHTVVATNVTNLQKRYDDRIASRLESKDDSMTFFFEGQDLRMP